MNLIITFHKTRSTDKLISSTLFKIDVWQRVYNIIILGNGFSGYVTLKRVR